MRRSEVGGSGGRGSISGWIGPLLVTLLLFPSAGVSGPPGPPGSLDGPRDGAVGAEGWPSELDGLASVTVEPESPWIAGSWVECRITFCADRVAIAPGGGVRVALRRGSNAGEIQATDPSGEGYATALAWGKSGPDPQALESLASHGYVSRPGDGPQGPVVRTEISALDRQGSMPWPRAVQVVLADGLPLGGTLRVVLGDRSAGGPGFRVQTMSEETSPLRAYTDGDGDGVFAPVPDPLPARVVGGEGVSFHMTAPAMIRVAEVFTVLLRAEDGYWNTALDYSGDVDLLVVKRAGPEFWTDAPEPGIHPVGGEGEIRHRWEIWPERWEDGRVVLGGVRLGEPGLYELKAEGDLESVSLPILVLAETPEMWLYWGDLHGHTELSDGAESPEAYFEFARWTAGLDFAASTDHDWMLSDAEWEASVRAAEAAYAPGRFVTFPAYEWSAQSGDGGHHDVYYVSGEPRLLRCERAARCDAQNWRELLSLLEGRDVFLIPHVGGAPGSWDFAAPGMKTVCEVHSAWGRNEQFGLLGIETGQRVGFIASSDTHNGHPGRSFAAPPTFQVESGGLAGVWAEALNREAVGDAVRARRTYASSGGRILIDVRVAGARMGEVADRPEEVDVIARVAGPVPIESMEIRRWWQTVFTESPGTMACTLRWTDPDPRVQETFYYLRVTLADGTVAWTSPVWVPSSFDHPPPSRPSPR